ADDDVGGQLFGRGVGLVDDGEVLVGQQLAAADDYQVRVFLVPGFDHLVDQVEDQCVEVLVVAGVANGDLAGGIHYLGKHAGCVLGAHLLQPADVDVLAQGVGGRVGSSCAAGAVPADQDAVQCLAAQDGV